MKLLAAILSIYLVMLPAVAHCPDCCMTDDGLQQTEHSDDCSDHCSPLCSACTCFTAEDCVRIQAMLQEILAETGGCRIQILASPFLKDIWQPPKFRLAK
jgi:hypothetical protein